MLNVMCCGTRHDSSRVSDVLWDTSCVKCDVLWDTSCVKCDVLWDTSCVKCHSCSTRSSHLLARSVIQAGRSWVVLDTGQVQTGGRL